MQHFQTGRLPILMKLLKRFKNKERVEYIAKN